MLFENQNGQQIVLTALKLCEQPNCLEWATMFIEGLICASHFISVYELCHETPLSYTLLGTTILLFQPPGCPGANHLHTVLAHAYKSFKRHYKSLLSNLLHFRDSSSEVRKQAQSSEEESVW